LEALEKVIEEEVAVFDEDAELYREANQCSLLLGGILISLVEQLEVFNEG